ncbi:MAG: alpha/beta hydrolase [Proteobacteria bacterium]|nr:alpha/beta hydrolase [Pseudomonadota bacterium]
MPTLASAQSAAPKGQIKGTAFAHTEASAKEAIARASVAVPASVTKGTVWSGLWRDAPRETAGKVPVVVFLHGSSGLGLKAIAEWQLWLAGLGIASIAPDSFALPDRVTYTSPIAKDDYERIHALRTSEIALAVAALKDAPWADPARLVLAGASEGGPAVARYAGPEFKARIMFAWSCEDNYFVKAHDTKIAPDQPVLNVISSSDPYFSTKNAWLGSGTARGHCAAAFAESKAATIVLIPGAPHTLMNLPQARAATRSFLEDVVKP